VSEKITMPGFFPAMTAADYHGDPCPAPSLTQSVAKILLERSPLHAWHAHPRLNPDWQADDDTKFDVGNIAHKLMLGRGKDIVKLDHDDWRTKAAREARDAAAAEGKLAVLGKHYGRAERMVAAGREQLALRGLKYVFSDGGQSELVMAWQEGDIWLRQMLDWKSSRIGSSIVADYKTTDLSAAPQNLGRQMVTAGWPVQAAMAERGLDVLEPDTAGRRDYLFVVQEAEAPYCLNVVQVGEAALTLGRKLLGMGVVQWRECLTADRWPGYPTEIIHPEIPSWFESGVLAREIEHEERRPRALPKAKFDGENLMAG
jgi:hypothetical protein